jgi:RNA 2',3'-cyclic 3'-phosphodiesterase
MIRLFAAVPAPFDIAEGLARRQQGLPGARWSPAENLHITLRFFGEVAEPVAAELDTGLSAIAMDSFEVALEGAGAFGEREHMRAVWAGVRESEPLRRLAAKCETVAKRCGLKAETRAYRPHMTLAYLKHSPEQRVAAWLQGHNLLQSPPWRVRQFNLYSSWRSADGSRYELERSYPLS